MISGWRLVKKKHAAGAFTGEGARRFGGRWNRRGTAVVYLSDTLSLAALETFVHLGSSYPVHTFAAFEVQIPDDLPGVTLGEAELPKEWRAEPAPDTCKNLGTEWVESNATVHLSVPSVIIPRQRNLVLNIAHPDYPKLKITRHPDFTFDPRMWK